MLVQWGKFVITKQEIIKQEIIDNFDPGGVGVDNGNLFGFPFDYETADVIVLGVPWEVTVSDRAGTAQGPAAILAASRQLDFYDRDHPTGWHQGIFMAPLDPALQCQNQELRSLAHHIIQAVEQGKPINSPALQPLLTQVNQGCEAMNQWVYHQSSRALEQGKRVIVVGGDHSVPLGYLQALSQHYPDFGILHIDAHADLRDSYEGFQYSHASIMFNVLKIPQITKLVQVGIRDVSQTEVELVESYQNGVAPSHPRVTIHFDTDLKQKQYAGIPWAELCRAIVTDLPENVYVSFDIDGLDPKLCPMTGTPVPGGLELEEAFHLLRQVVKRQCTIIGADLSEVGNGKWDGNVGARIVYKLFNLMGQCLIT
ncbi:MAG: agmatinase family protein [Cyanothece sp. SIO2G6]|nr:agmatinase family protein [Cyanothece sp. SIO2G6]